ncbi:MAG: ATP-dependent DNA ligase [Acidimicrobiia bacterium]|nr:ATP-dependent DNA ligase [Acidimicrobiia bacterium]
MPLPVELPLAPMLARAAKQLPEDPGLIYEPKWDGFRCIVARDHDELTLTSRNGRDLGRYFPELVAPLTAQLPERCVLDGELVVHLNGVLDFDALGARVHPAQSRVVELAAATPASFIAFDLLALADRSLLDEPFAERRAAAEQVLATSRAPLHLSTITTDVELARRWLAATPAGGIDGVMAKDPAGHYEPGKRILRKIKRTRTADAVVAGFRDHTDGAGVGSLLLGMYAGGLLVHVGVASSFTAATRSELRTELAPLVAGPDDRHPWLVGATASADQEPSGAPASSPNRWQSGPSPWTPLRIERVAEVSFTHASAGRFRGTTRLVRWRPDRTPESCTFDQLDEPERPPAPGALVTPPL